MKLLKISVSALCALMTLGMSSNASALTLVESIDVTSVYTEGDASYVTGFGRFAGLHMQASGQSSFATGFTIPPTYTPGDPIYIGIFWHTNSDTTPCDISLRPNSISVARIGSTHIQGPFASTGLAPQDGTTVLNATAANTTSVKIYTITSPDGVTDLQPWDAVNFGLFRRPSSSADTCTGALVVQGIAVAIP